MTAAVRYAVEMGRELRRRALLDVCSAYARRARRARLILILDEIRQIGAQLDALTADAPEAPDVLKAASRLLVSISRDLDESNA